MYLCRAVTHCWLPLRCSEADPEINWEAATIGDIYFWDQ